MKKQDYHYGIDLLRLVAMFMIVVTHVLAQGGIRKEVASNFDSHYFVTWLLQIAVYWAVNAYALISGYVGSRSRFRYSKMLELWLQTIFYSLSFALLFHFSGKSLSLADWRNALFPILTGKYWYVTAYFGLLIVMPVLNLALERLATVDLRRLLLLSFVSFSLVPALFNNKLDEFALDRGYSSLWLVVLYLAGAYLARQELTRLPKTAYLLLIYLLSVVLSFLLKQWIGKIWFWYTSPTMVVGALCVFIIFARLKVRSAWLQGSVRLLAPTTLGIYLIHLNPLVVRFLLRDFAQSFVDHPVPLFLLYIFGASALIFFLSSGLDLLRLWLFQKLRLQRLSAWCDRYFPYQSKT